MVDEATISHDLSEEPVEDIEALEEIMKKIKSLPSVTDAVLMTKTGIFVLGSIRRSTSLERFVGMSAILMGSAEAASLELKEAIRGVVIHTKNLKVAIITVTENILLVVTLPRKKDHLKTFQELGPIINQK
jgi:predicted regulator of Ras-like GTPase activity (Roadblock/LC7/MglB family)